MSKILRLHTGSTATGGDNIDGWGKSNLIDDKAIASIRDPQGEAPHHEITSIPSPFARMDLMMQAFKFVNDEIDAAKNDDEVKKAFNGNTIHHKMVSDMLDVAEIFFNIDKYTNPANPIIKLRHWSAPAIQALKNSADNEKKLFGETLDLFIETDKDNGGIYHLQNLQDMFFLEYVGPGSPAAAALPGHIIGATSPNTLFFTPAGDLSYVSEHILFEGNNDRPFDAAYNPLYSRSDAFINYMVALRYMDGFGSNFPSVAAYIDHTCTYLNSIDKRVNPVPLSELPVTNVVFDGGIQVTIPGGYPVMKMVYNPATIAQQSQFTIRPTKNLNGGLPPLVLPADYSCDGWTYTNSKWDPNTMCGNVPVKFSDAEPIDDRLLPCINVKYPYLTLGDFLEENLICTDFSNASFLDTDGNVHDSDYFSLGDKKSGLDCYLIPVKKCFFDYFNLADLRNQLHATKLQENLVRVTLDIPVKGNGSISKITFEREYKLVEEGGTINNPEKRGQIIRVGHTGITLLPHIKFKDETDKTGKTGKTRKVVPNYRVTLFIDDAITEKKAERLWPAVELLKIRDGVEGVEIVDFDEEVCRNYNSTEAFTIDYDTNVSKTYSVSKNFDIVQISYGGCKNLVIPEYRIPCGGKDKFTFAVDLGTTNTHIEFSVNESLPQAFCFGGKDAQLRPSYGLNCDSDWSKVMDGDLIPRQIGEGFDVSFPIRTVLTCERGSDWKRDVVPLGKSNIPFFYGKKIQPKYNEAPFTNLKWDTTDGESENRRKNFIENLAILMRNKVLMNNGDLCETNIVWFYPTSMKPTMVGELEKIWAKIYANYFGGQQDNVTSIPEAVAPVFYYKEATTDAVTIDIGGETSDFSFAVGRNIEFVSSARFASNSLFGDGLCGVNMDNGFISHFKADVEEILKADDSKYKDLVDIIQGIEIGTNASTNLASFFFSLKDNSEITDSTTKEALDFTKMLSKSPEACAILLIYYMALIYYVANVIKEKGLKEPRHIGFSGNGSKVLRVFFNNRASKTCVVKIAKAIFEKVLGRDYGQDDISLLEIQNGTPKQATAKGGIAIIQNEELANMFNPDFAKRHTIVWTGATHEHAISENHSLKYGDIDKCADFSAVEAHVRAFVDICKKTIEETDAKDYIKLPENMEVFFAHKSFILDLRKHIQDGITREHVRGDEDVTTPLFFYPIEGILHNLANEIFGQ